MKFGCGCLKNDCETLRLQKVLFYRQFSFYYNFYFFKEVMEVILSFYRMQSFKSLTFLCWHFCPRFCKVVMLIFEGFSPFKVLKFRSSNR